MDAFKDQLSRRAHDTGRPQLAHQSRGQEPSPAELALSSALMEIFGEQTHDFADVAAQLARRKIAAPISGRTDWDEALLASELAELNAIHDRAYAEHGYGA